ncbi:MAG: helix-turn-helix transcriptional regulator [Clostridia bacterium]|nr:helix-turn-helix transcriptional regulator [Clostridia bacterium]
MNCLISKRIREARKENNLNQSELAKLCNVKQSCVSKWERGETLPDLVMVIKLCEILRVSSDYILGIKEY